MTINDMIETRFIEDSAMSVSDRVVSGYAIVFNSPSKVMTVRTGEGKLIKFVETISPAAVEGVLDKSDIRMLLNHNIDRGILARSKFGTGSLTYSVDERGVRYEFEAPKTSLGDEILEGIKRGDITSNSFAFIENRDKTVYSKGEDGIISKTVNSFADIRDFSVVYNPAYDAAVIDSRSIEAAEEELAVREEQAAAPVGPTDEELAVYYAQLKLKCGTN